MLTQESDQHPLLHCHREIVSASSISAWIKADAAACRILALTLRATRSLLQRMHSARPLALHAQALNCLETLSACLSLYLSASTPRFHSAMQMMRRSFLWRLRSDGTACQSHIKSTSLSLGLTQPTHSPYPSTYIAAFHVVQEMEDKLVWWHFHHGESHHAGPGQGSCRLI